MKNTIAHFIGYAVILAASVGLLFSILGIITIWRMRVPTAERLSSTLEIAEDTFAATNDGLTLVQTSLDKAITDVTSLVTTIQSTSNAISDTTSMVDTLITLTGEDIPNTVTATQTAMSSAQASAKVIDDALRVITSIPLIGGEPYNPPVPLHIALGEVSESLDPLAESSTSIKDSLRISRGNLVLLRAELNIIARHVSKINESLYTSRLVVSQYQDIVTRLSNRIAKIQAKLPQWMKAFIWIATSFLIWFGIIQVGLLMQGLELTSRKKTNNTG